MKQPKTGIVGLFLSLVASPIFADGLKAATAPWSPFAMETKGKPTGIAVEITAEIMRRSKENIELFLYPAPRLRSEFEHARIDMNFADSPVWNDPNDKSYFFSNSYLTLQEFIFSRSDNAIDLQRPEDLIGKEVGIRRGY